MADESASERCSRVLYGSALTGGAPIVDDSPGASDRFWQAMIDSVKNDPKLRSAKP